MHVRPLQARVASALRHGRSHGLRHVESPRVSHFRSIADTLKYEESVEVTPPAFRVYDKNVQAAHPAKKKKGRA